MSVFCYSMGKNFRFFPVLPNIRGNPAEETCNYRLVAEEKEVLILYVGKYGYDGK